MNPSKFYKNWASGLSFFLSVTMMISSFVSTPTPLWAADQALLQPVQPEAQKMLRQLENLPRNFGSIEKNKITDRSSRLPMIVHIQDAHASPSAQKNIQEILNYLHQTFPQMLVAVEGAAGPLHPEYFDFFPQYPKANQQMINDLAAKGEISGAELFAWNEYQKAVMPDSLPVRQAGIRHPINGSRVKARDDIKNQPLIFGIEEPALYRTNLKQFKTLLESRDEIDTVLQYLRGWLATMESKNLSSDLRNFLREKDRRKEGRYSLSMSQGNSDFSAYFSMVVKESKNNLGIDLENPIEQFRFPQLVRFLILQKEEKKWNLESAQNQWNDLLQDLRRIAKTDSEKALVQSLDIFSRKELFAQSGSSQEPLKQAAYARALVEKLARFSEKRKWDLGKFPLAVQSLRMFIFQSEIDGPSLFKEVEFLESAILSKFAKTEDEKKWVTHHDALALLEKLLHLELTHTELNKIKGNDIVTPLIREARLSREEKCLEWVRSAFDFYQTALKRDQVLAQKALQGARDQKADLLVLVTGGFHQEGIQTILEKEKYSYAVVTPSMAVDSARIYLDVMSGKNADLSIYFKNQNPFASERESIFFKSMLETAVPSLVKDYQISSEKLPEIFAQTFAQNPLLAQSLRSQIVKTEDRLSVVISPKIASPSLQPERFTLARELLSSGKNLDEPSASVPAFVSLSFSGAEAAFHLEIAPSANSEVRLPSSNVRVTAGRITPEMMLARSRSELRIKKVVAVAPENFEAFIQAGVKSKNVPIDLSDPDIIGARGSSFADLMSREYDGVTLEELANELGNVDVPELMDTISTTDVAKPGIEGIVKTLKGLSGDERQVALKGLLYLSTWDDLSRQLFADSPKLNANVFLAVTASGARVRAQFFEFLAAKSKEAKRISQLAQASARAEVRHQKVVAATTDTVPTDALMQELRKVAAGRASREPVSVGFGAALLASIQPVQISLLNAPQSMDSLAEQALRLGLMDSVTPAMANLRTSILNILGLDGLKLERLQTPAVRIEIPIFSDLDMTPEGVKRFVNEQMTLYVEGIFNPLSRVEIIMPASAAEARIFQNAFAVHSRRLGLDADYVSVRGVSSSRVVAETLKAVRASSSKQMIASLLTFDESPFEHRSFPRGVVPVSAAQVDRQTAYVVAPNLLRASEISNQNSSYTRFVSLLDYMKKLGLRSDLGTRLSLLVQTLLKVNASA